MVHDQHVDFGPGVLLPVPIRADSAIVPDRALPTTSRSALLSARARGRADASAVLNTFHRVRSFLGVKTRSGRCPSPCVFVLQNVSSGRERPC